MRYAGFGMLIMLFCMTILFRRFRSGQIAMLMPKGISRIWYPFYFRIGLLMYKGRNVSERIRKAYPLENPDEVYARRCIRIGRYIYCAVLGVAFAMIAADYGIQPEYKIQDGYYITRSEDDGQPDYVSAKAISEDLEEQEIVIEIRDKLLEGDALDELFVTGEAYVLKMLVGDNASLMEVRSGLHLVTEVPGTSMAVQWNLNDTLLILSDGQLDNQSVEESGVMQSLSFSLLYGDTRRDYPLVIKVFPPLKTESEKVNATILDLIDQQNANSENADMLKLPDQIQGKKIRWQESNADARISVVLFVVLGLVVFGVYTFQDESRALKLRKQQLEDDYPVFIHKLVLMNSAGMNMQAALSAMVKERQQMDGQHMHYVYKEADVALKQMGQGVSEVKAYELFGKNCDSTLYLKLSSLMIQCVKKGASGMNELMSEMAAEALMMRKDMVRQKAEKTSTRLLLPMGMILVVVFAILILPAFLSMKI